MIHITFVLLLHIGLSDPEAREQSLLTLLHSLPPVNFKTAVFLFKHLRRYVHISEICTGEVFTSTRMYVY